MYKNRDWFILAPFGALAFALAYWGFSRCLGTDCKPDPFWKILQKSFGLVRGQGDFSFEKDAWQLVIAQYLVPAVFFVTAAKLFLINLRRDARVALARRSSDHTIVCGLGNTGSQIVRHLRDIGETVVAIDLKDDTAAAASCEHSGVPVIKGDATSAKTLELAGLPRARALVLTTGSDSVNLEIVLRADETCARKGVEADSVLGLPEFRSKWLFSAVSAHGRATIGTSLQFKPFSTHDIASRLLYRSATFARRRLLLGIPEPHLVIIGFGSLGAEVMLQGIRTHLALRGHKPRFTVLDRDAETIAHTFSSENPNVFDVAQIEFVAGTFRESGALPELQNVVRDVAPTAIVIALGEDDLCLFVALRIRAQLDHFGHVTTPVYVRLREKPKLGEFAAHLERAGPLRHRLVSFGSITEVTNVGILFEHRLDRIARAMHEEYRKSLHGNSEGVPSSDLGPWIRLPEFYKQANRRAADFIGLNVRAAGLRLRPSNEARQLVLSTAEIEQLAANEHWRWSVELRMAGWEYGADRSEARRLHPLLVPWEMLPVETQAQNRSAVQKLPEILSTVGLELRREALVAAMGDRIADAKQSLSQHRISSADRHLVVVVDPNESASVAIGSDALKVPDTSIWLLLSPGGMEAFRAPLDQPSLVADLAQRAEGWINESELAH